MLKYINIFIVVNFIFISLILFFVKSKNRKSNILLSIALLILAYLDFLNIVVGNHYAIYKYLIYTPHICVYAVWPVMYFYFLSNLNKRIKINFKIIFHFIFVIFLIIRYIMYLFLLDEQKEKFIRVEFSKTHLEFQIILLFLYFVIVPIYVILSFIACIKEKNIKKDYYSTLDDIKYNWIFQFLIVLLAVNILVIILIFLDIVSYKYFHNYAPIITFMIFLYMIYKSLSSSNIFNDFTEFKENLSDLKDNNRHPLIIKELDNIESHRERIIKYFIDNKPFLKPELNISNLARDLEIPSYILSYIINKGFKKNFFDFINSYRIEEVKKRLVSPEYKNLKIESIGHDSGFNSRASFYQIFKKYTDLTPSEYRMKYT